MGGFDTGRYVLSDPVVADGTVFVGSMSHSLYALKAADGSLLWSYKTMGPDGVEAPGGWVYGGPAFADGKVFVGGDDGCVYAFKASGSAPTPSPSSSVTLFA